MRNPGTLRRCALGAALALAGVLLAGRPAAAQVFVISPDRSIVNIGQPQPFPLNPGFSVTPVVVGGNRFVRLSGNFTFTQIDPLSVQPPGFGFIRPFTPNDRARAANFYGAPNYNPNPVVTGPFQPWWR
jgi:hypothetical protein